MGDVLELFGRKAAAKTRSKLCGRTIELEAYVPQLSQTLIRSTRSLIRPNPSAIAERLLLSETVDNTWNVDLFRMERITSHTGWKFDGELGHDLTCKKVLNLLAPRLKQIDQVNLLRYLAGQTQPQTLYPPLIMAVHRIL